MTEQSGNFNPDITINTATEREAPKTLKIVDIDPQNETHADAFANIEAQLDTKEFDEVSEGRDSAIAGLRSPRTTSTIDRIKIDPNDRTQRIFLGVKEEGSANPFDACVYLYPAHKPEDVQYRKDIGIRDTGDKPTIFELSHSNTIKDPDAMGKVMTETMATIYGKTLGKPFRPGEVTADDMKKVHDEVGMYALSGQGEEEYQQSLAAAGFVLHGNDKFNNTVWTINPDRVMNQLQVQQRHGQKATA